MGNRPNKTQQSKTLLLLSEDYAIAERLMQALQIYGLSNNLDHHTSLEQYQASLVEQALLPDSVNRVDLVLIAHVDDEQRALETLTELRDLKRWRFTPTVVFLTNPSADTAHLLYYRGANSVLRYPLHFNTLQKLARLMDEYWFNTVRLPKHES